MGDSHQSPTTLGDLQCKTIVWRGFAFCTKRTLVFGLTDRGQQSSSLQRAPSTAHGDDSIVLHRTNNVAVRFTWLAHSESMKGVLYRCGSLAGQGMARWESMRCRCRWFVVRFERSRLCIASHETQEGGIVPSGILCQRMS